MKKVLCVLAGALCCALCTFSVRADVIWEPDDSFYKMHSEDCVYVNREYTANGPDGKVFLYKSPEMPITVLTWENGFRAKIYYTYRDADGIQWGIFDNYNGTIGWMPMEYMELVYDSISFREEYAAEIREEVDSLDKKYNGESVFFWRYPGSEEYVTVQLEDEPAYRSVYVDGNGNSWGHIGYYYGYKDKWICIDDPMADYAQLFPDGFPGAAGADGTPGMSAGADGMSGTATGADGTPGMSAGADGMSGTATGADGTPGTSEGADGMSAGADGAAGTESGTGGTTAAANPQSRGGERIVPRVNPVMTATAAGLVLFVVAVTVILLLRLKKKTNS